MDRADKTARELLKSATWAPVLVRMGTVAMREDEAVVDIAQAIRKAQGDIEGEVCPHWTPGLAKLVSDAIWMARRNMSRRDFDVLGAVKDELDTLIQQAEAKGGR